MPRPQLFELEDQAWFPTVPRDLATDYLRSMETRFALHRPAVALLAELLQTTSATTVVDLCSGGGGPIERVREDLDAKGLSVDFTLTDRYPNVPEFERAANASGDVSRTRPTRLTPVTFRTSCEASGHCSMHFIISRRATPSRCCETPRRHVSRSACSR
jgi:hypothetical protein